MSTHEPEWNEMILGHALHSAAESIEPRSDGLDKIQTRLRPRPYPLLIAWAEAIWMRLGMWVPEGAYSAGHQLAAKLRTVSERFLRGPDRDSQAPGGLLRPLVAFGIAVFIVAVGAYVAIEVPAVVSPASGHGAQQNPGHNGQGNPGGVAGNSSSAFPSSGSGRSTGASGNASSPYPVLTPPPGPCAHSSASSSKSPGPTATPTQTGTGSPSPSGTPTPTPTPTSSTPTSSASPSSAAGTADAQATTDAVILPATAEAPSLQFSASSCSPSPHKTKRTTKKRPNHSNSPVIAKLGAAKPT